MIIRKLEDLEVWQEARTLCKGIYKLTEYFPKSEEYNLKKHLKENGRGVPSNIAEGFGRYFFKESLRFYGIAKGCLGEMKSDLYISFDNEYFGKDVLDKYIERVDKIERMLNGLISSIRKKIKY